MFDFDYLRCRIEIFQKCEGNYLNFSPIASEYVIVIRPVLGILIIRVVMSLVGQAKNRAAVRTVRACFETNDGVDIVCSYLLPPTHSHSCNLGCISRLQHKAGPT